MSDAVQDLPGFDLKTLVRKSYDIADLSEEKEYTAERLLVSHPERYEIARRLFFEIGLSKRGICDICRLNSRTLNALIEREMKTRGADFLYEKVRRKRALITYQLCEQLEELAADPKACKEAGINGLVSAIRLIQDQSNRTIDVPPSSNTSTTSPAPDGVEYAKLYRLNGLDSEKNSARAIEVVEGSERAPNAKTDALEPAAPSGSFSILLSGGYKDLQGISPTVDKLDAKTGADGSTDGVTDPPTDGHGADGEPADGKRPDSGG